MRKHSLIPFFSILFIVFIGFILFYTKIKDYSSDFISSYGLIAIFLIVIVMDTVIQPISPDILIFGATLNGANLFAVSLLGGIGSCIAGVLGYHIGKSMGSEKFEERFGKKHLNKGKNLFDKYGIWAVIVGAFSPIPYSSICWTAGIYNMKFKPFLITSLLTRIPRFFLMGFIGYII